MSIKEETQKPIMKGSGPVGLSLTQMEEGVKGGKRSWGWKWAYWEGYICGYRDKEAGKDCNPE